MLQCCYLRPTDWMTVCVRTDLLLSFSFDFYARSSFLVSVFVNLTNLLRYFSKWPWQPGRVIATFSCRINIIIKLLGQSWFDQQRSLRTVVYGRVVGFPVGLNLEIEFIQQLSRSTHTYVCIDLYIT